MQKPSPAAPWLLLISRSVLFLAFQALLALAFTLFGQTNSWDKSAGWWVLTIIPANLVSIDLLGHAFRAEDKRFLDIFRFSRPTLKKDLLWFFGSSLIGLPLAFLPISNLAILIFGDSMTPVNMMFRPLPVWALLVGILFPLTIAFAELPTYFGYVMPRLAVQLKNGWLAWLLCAFFLAAQHMFLPFLLDGKFILWRLGMYLPFALFAGLLLKFRPQLLPYFAIVHALMDFATLGTYLMI